MKKKDAKKNNEEFEKEKVVMKESKKAEKVKEGESKKEEIAEEVAEKITKEIEKKKKLPKEIKDKINKKVLKNLLVCILVMLYFYFVNLGYANIQSDIFVTDMKVFSFFILAMAIILFEKAYKEDSAEICVYGLEALAVALVTMCVPFVFFYLSVKFRIIFMESALLFAIYYVAKCIVIERKMVKEYRKSLSDIKEIVKKEKRKSTN